MNQTPNYQLSQWEATDKVQRVDFNEDNAKIDSALKAHDATLSAHTAQIARLGNCQIWTTTYTGTGEYGVDHPTSLTFPKKPVVAMIESAGGKPTFLLPRDGWMYNYEAEWLVHLSWSGSTATWYIDPHDQASSNKQLNGRFTYRVLALLPADQ